MVGLFDSGSGGLNTVRYIKEDAPDVDLVYLIDRARAPYGIKTEKELVRITSDNIEKLIDRGARRVLIACCTASTVHSLLPPEHKGVSIPIIKDVAKHAKNATRIGSIGVIATSHTVSTHAFRDELPDCSVSELALTELVSLIDAGLSDKTVTEQQFKAIEAMIKPILLTKIDTLILGCTHFPSLVKTIEKIARPYGVHSVIDSARVGAELLAEESRKQYVNKNAV